MSAGFGVEELKATISSSGGMAQPHQFMVQLPQLASINIDARDLSLLCSATVLPGRQITSIDQAMGKSYPNVDEQLNRARLHRTLHA